MHPIQLLISSLLFLSLFENSLAAHSSHQEEKGTILVTCATGELGSTIAKLLGEDYHLILAGRDSLKLLQLKESLHKDSYKCETLLLDYSNYASIENFRKDRAKNPCPIKGVVLITPRPFFGKDLLQSEENWLNLFQTTFTGPLEVLKSTLPYLSSGSKVVVIAGTTSVQLQPEYGPACVIRRMWTTYCKALSHHLGPKGIHVNVISPGVVLTNFHRERIDKKAKEIGGNFEEELAKDAANIPLQRHARPLEIAKSIRFLLSEDSNFITGMNLVIDGGKTVSY